MEPAFWNGKVVCIRAGVSRQPCNEPFYQVVQVILEVVLKADWTCMEWRSRSVFVVHQRPIMIHFCSSTKTYMRTEEQEGPYLIALNASFGTLAVHLHFQVLRTWTKKSAEKFRKAATPLFLFHPRYLPFPSNPSGLFRHVKIEFLFFHWANEAFFETVIYLCKLTVLGRKEKLSVSSILTALKSLFQLHRKHIRFHQISLSN